MNDNEKILEGYSDEEKGAYLGTIASIATADRVATPEEVDYISALCDAADLSPQHKQSVLHAATDLSGNDLNQNLDRLKQSELKYSLVADLMAFAKSDNDYSETEQQSIQKISQYLGLDQQQFSVLDQFAEKATEQNAVPDPTASPNFLSATGLQHKLQSAGINSGSLLKGLLSFAGPMILGKLLTGALGGRNSASRMQNRGGMGGLGSIISMLSGGRGLGSMGGLFGRIFGRH